MIELLLSFFLYKQPVEPVKYLEYSQECEQKSQEFWVTSTREFVESYGSLPSGVYDYISLNKVRFNEHCLENKGDVSNFQWRSF